MHLKYLNKTILTAEQGSRPSVGRTPDSGNIRKIRAVSNYTAFYAYLDRIAKR